MGGGGVLVLDLTEDLLTIDLEAAVGDDLVADLTDENKETSGGVVVLGVSPDQQDGVHDWDKVVSHLMKLKRGVLELSEIAVEGLEIFVVLIGLETGDLNLLLELGEGRGLGRLVLLEELEDLLDALSGELVADRVKVLTLVLPEVNFGDGTGVNGLLEGLLGVLAELSLDLLGPLS